jgi:ABC-2 type transport system ATP-binding protein
MIDVDDLSVVVGRGVRRPERAVLDHVSFQVREGDSFALLGPNGAGKSTTIYCMLGLLRPTSGSVRVFGRVLEPGCPSFRDIAFVPEEPHYHDYLTVEEAVRYYATLHGEHVSPARLSGLLEELRLETARTSPLSACSKGMKQKVGLARCLIRVPRLLILDEPMRGLDPVTVKHFRDTLIDLNRRGATIVMNSHQLSEIEQMASRAAILANGRLLTAAPISELTAEERNVYVIEIDGLRQRPDYLTIQQTMDGRVRGTVPAERLYEFMELARASGAIVRSCAIKKQSLEESFFAALGESERVHV